MHVLALDTTTREGSAALVDERGVIEERRGEGPRSQAERLPGELLALAEARGLPITSIDVFAIASGPGSFTGLRIGIATIQGLAVTTHRHIVAVSALDALAQCASTELSAGALVAAWMDARRHTVFAALYRVTDAPLFTPERLVPIDGPLVDRPDATLERWAGWTGGTRTVFVGDGATLYEGVIKGDGLRNVGVLGPPLLAGAIGQMAVVRASRGETIDPAAVQPLYVRRPDAEVERDRRRLLS